MNNKVVQCIFIREEERRKSGICGQRGSSFSFTFLSINVTLVGNAFVLIQGDAHLQGNKHEKEKWAMTSAMN